MKQEKSKETSLQMSSASFMKEPSPSTTVMHQMDFNVFFGNTEYYLKDEPFKIIRIIVDDKIGIFAHKDVLRYMIKII